MVVLPIISAVQPIWAQKVSNKPLNIVCIFTDDHAFQTISAYGHPISKLAPTPNIDRLAGNGMLFTQSFVENSISAPSRATLLTGLYSHQHGQTRLGCCLNPQKQWFTELLQKKGYVTSVFGKWHLNVEPKGFDHYDILFDQGEYYNPKFRRPDTNGEYIKEKGYDPLVYKLFSYSCHYRNKLNFTWEGIDSASKSLERLRNSYQTNLNGTDELSDEDKTKLSQIEENFHKAINDDLNMPLAMSFVWEAARFEKKNPEVAKLLAKFDTVLGIKIDEINSKKEEIPQEILDLAEQRKIARENKDWAKSDELRDLINEKGYNVKDTKNGQEISVK